MKQYIAVRSFITTFSLLAWQTKALPLEVGSNATELQVCEHELYVCRLESVEESEDALSDCLKDLDYLKGCHVELDIRQESLSNVEDALTDCVDVCRVELEERQDDLANTLYDLSECESDRNDLQENENNLEHELTDCHLELAESRNDIANAIYDLSACVSGNEVLQDTLGECKCSLIDLGRKETDCQLTLTTCVETTKMDNSQCYHNVVGLQTELEDTRKDLASAQAELETMRKNMADELLSLQRAFDLSPEACTKAHGTLGTLCKVVQTLKSQTPKMMVA